MSFSAVGNGPSSLIVPGDGWWPDLPVADMQQTYRLPQEYADALLQDHLELAALWAQRQLEGWRQQREAEGCAALADVPRGALRLYRRAVFCHAKALLLAQFATVERREAAKNDAKESPDLYRQFYAWAQDAITDILSRPRADIDLL
ncbi:head completion/stabilization protein [uncultured Desulfovibrio sp.]|uniref:head completion/stabilization protein n=1 Tax=uncultured Desulfovibrio sp. TaxID=167968 RepID=UPI00266B634C|nr:head completion/stabilization protein [uncultured Desulfovibrio sp.]